MVTFFMKGELEMNYKKVGICAILIVVLSLLTLILYFVVKRQIIFNDSVNKRITDLENTDSQGMVTISTPEAEVIKEDIFDIQKFSEVNPYENKLYCNYDSTVFGSVNDSICENLPYNMDNLGYIYSFAYYDGYIYYLTGDLGSAILPASIYKYDVNKKSSICIADNAQTASVCYIVNGTLFYETAEFNQDDMIDQGGIGKFNLQTGERNQIYATDMNLQIGYCRADGIYMKTTHYPDSENYFCIDYDGKNEHALSKDEIQVFDHFISGNYAYSIHDGMIYRYDLNQKETKHYLIPKSIDKYMLMQDSGYVENIIDNKIYYRISAKSDSEELRMVNSLLLRCDMDGENTEIVATRFRS